MGHIQLDKPRPDKRVVIASLAILKVNSDNGADYIENFVPFAAECLRKSNDEVVSLDNLQRDFRSEFGLDIDQAPLRTILDRVVKAGFAKRERHAYIRDTKALEGLPFEATRELVLRQVNALVQRLVAQSELLLPVAWAPSEAESAFLHYLASRGTSLLASTAAEIPIALPDGTAPNAEYVLSSFVSHLHRNDPEGFEFLTSAVKGSVLASVLYFDNFGSIGRHFDRLDLYLDTVVLIHALGLVGPSQQAASLETLNLAGQLGARLWCFRETLKEIDGVLTFAANYIRNGQRRDVPIWGATEHLVQQGKTASDVDLIAAHIEADLRAIGVGVRDRPPPKPEWTVDELELAKQLRNSVRYRADAPLQHDLDAVTAIHRLRGGRPMPMIETAGAMFLTTNTPLARTTTSFFRDEYETTTFAPLCMPVHQFGTLAWLKKPLASPELPTKLVIADALAALNPPESVWKDYIREIAKLEESGSISIDDCYLLRYSPAAKEALMGITIGGSRAFLQGSVPDIMARVRTAERQDAEQRAMSERSMREAAEVDAARALAAAKSAHEAEVSSLAAILDEISATSETGKIARMKRYHKIGMRIARVVVRSLLAIYLAVAAIQLYGLSPVQPLGPPPRDWTHPLVGLVLVSIFIVGTILALRGRGLLDELKGIETRIATGTANRLFRLIEDDLITLEPQEDSGSARDPEADSIGQSDEP